MPDQHPLTNRIRNVFSQLPEVEEKKMFGGIAFMVKGKMCVCSGKNGLLCRIDPARHEQALQQAGCRTMEMKGRPLIGYVHVSEEALAEAEALEQWLQLALDFNEQAKASSKKKR